jgi:hypothetical protein
METFLSVSGTSRYQPQLHENTESLLRKECAKPYWCVVGLQAGAPVARAALWALPGQAVPTDRSPSPRVEKPPEAPRANRAQRRFLAERARSLVASDG